MERFLKLSRGIAAEAIMIIALFGMGAINTQFIIGLGLTCAVYMGYSYINGNLEHG